MFPRSQRTPFNNSLFIFFILLTFPLEDLHFLFLFLPRPTLLIYQVQRNCEYLGCCILYILYLFWDDFPGCWFPYFPWNCERARRYIKVGMGSSDDCIWQDATTSRWGTMDRLVGPRLAIRRRCLWWGLANRLAGGSASSRRPAVSYCHDGKRRTLPRSDKETKTKHIRRATMTTTTTTPTAHPWK